MLPIASHPLPTVQRLGARSHRHSERPLALLGLHESSAPFVLPHPGRRWAVADHHHRSRIRLKFSKHLFVGKAKLEDSLEFSGQSFATVSSILLTAEKEEARAILSLFLMKQGLSTAVTAWAVNKSDPFVNHLISKLRSMRKSHYLLGRELTMLERRDVLVSYLESLLKEYGGDLITLLKEFPIHPGVNKAVAKAATSPVRLVSKKVRARVRPAKHKTEYHLLPHVLYLIELGLDLDRIERIISRFPAFLRYSLEFKVRPLVEFLCELGVPTSDIPSILYRRPQLCGLSIEENLMPTMEYLEHLGVDKTKWAKVIYRCPSLLSYTKLKIEATADYLSELGLSASQIGKVLTKFPGIISYSVDGKLRSTESYLRSLGVDVASVVYRSPQTFALNVEGTIKPITEFFLDKGYSVDEIKAMFSRFPLLYTLSVVENLMPKWEFFLTMDYPKSELVKFPHFFGYSLEGRIKPRYNCVKERKIQLSLNKLLVASNEKFMLILQKKRHEIA